MSPGALLYPQVPAWLPANASFHSSPSDWTVTEILIRDPQMFHLLAPSFSNLLSNTRKNPVLTTKTHSESRLGTGLLSSSPQPIFPAVSPCLAWLALSPMHSTFPRFFGHPAFPCPRGHSNVHHLQLYMHSVSFPRKIYRGQFTCTPLGSSDLLWLLAVLLRGYLACVPFSCSKHTAVSLSQTRNESRVGFVPFKSLVQPSPMCAHWKAQ